MAYYAALISLKVTINRLLNSSQVSFLPHSREIIEFTYKEVIYIQEVLDLLQSWLLKNSTNEEVYTLFGQIRDAACKLEDALESHISDQFLSQSESLKEGRPINLCPDLEELKQGINYIKKSMNKLEKTIDKILEESRNPVPEEDDEVSSGIQFGGDGTKMVGFSHLFEKIKHELTGSVPKDHPTCVSIVGMAGIGKTTLVKEIYKDQLVYSHFDSCAWVTIGPECRFRKVLVHDKLHKEGEWIFVEDLCTRFKGRKYLIVVDDIWSKKDVRKLARSLPRDEFTGNMVLLTTRLEEVANYANTYERFGENNYFYDFEDEDNLEVVWSEGSILREHSIRSMISPTTRLQEVASYANKYETFGENKYFYNVEDDLEYANTSYYFHQMRLLDEEESWTLLRQKVFGEECSCPFHLEKAGRKIAKKCEGLPLTIVTVANILSKSEKTLEYWNKVAEELYSSVFTDAYEQMSKVLFPSYKYLSHYLKAFFLYMGLFPPSSKIHASKLIRLWIAEGILEPVEFKSLKDLGMGCLRDLVSSNVVLVEQHRSSDGIKTCKLNSAFWYLCTREAGNEKFFHVLRTHPNSFTESVESQRRICVFNNILFAIKDVHKLMDSITSVHSLLCTGLEHRYPVPLFTCLRLLRVLDALTIHFYSFPVQVLKLVHLRYLALTCSRNIPASISDLWNLQYLIVCRLLSINKSSRDQLYVPVEIWDMRELKHIQIMGSNLPDPCGSLLPNLLSISDISVNSCTKDILERVPKLEKLGVRIELATDTDETMYCFDHLSVLDKLQSFKCVIVNPNPSRSQIVAPPTSVTTFPSSLKKLSLSGFGYPWERIKVIAQLPNLEVLKLRCYAFRGPEWVLHHGELKRLRYLLLEDTDLVHWKASISCFLNLDNLIIRHCYKLKEFPYPKHRYNCNIELVDCPLVEDSIRQRAREFPSFSFFVRSSWYDGKVKS